MNFFGNQEEAKRATTVLIVLFGGAIVCLTGLLYVCCLFLFDFIGHEARSGWWREDIALFVGVGTLIVIGTGSIYKIHHLRGGGSAVALGLGGRPLSMTGADHRERTLLNIVEEMAIASGVPVPQVWVLDRQTGINAFAAGYGPADAVIGVTRGCLLQFDREELQGVIAHEFSHILNGDMRLNIRLMGVLHGLVCLSIAGGILLRSSSGSGSRRGSGPLLGLGLALVIVGSLGILFARLIKAGVSRQREFLADASAVQFTRNPGGIASALKRIGGMLPPRAFGRVPGSTIDHPRAEEASHMFFGSALRSSIAGWFATHPPLLERIRKIEPNFTGGRADPSMDHSEPTATPQGAIGFAGQGFEATPVTSVDRAVESVGTMNRTQLAYGAQLLHDLPTQLRHATDHPFSARAIIYSLLLAPKPADRREQLKRISNSADPATLEETINLSDLVRELDTATRLPLVDLTMPALRTLSQPQFEEFAGHVNCLIETCEPNIFAFCLQKAVLRHLRECNGQGTRGRVRHTKLETVRKQCKTVLSCLAHAGHTDQDAAQKAYTDGLAFLDLPTTGNEVLKPPQSIQDLGTALDELAVTSNYGKRSILIACARAAASDGVIETAELELLRAVADTLECPMPPVAQTCDS